jgi:hypothetical protein
MALNFNPFDKGKAAPTPKTKSKHSHYRVFDDPTKENTVHEQKTEETGPNLPEPSQQQTVEKTPSKTDYKQATNGSQADHKEVTEESENGSRTDHKQSTKKTKRTTQRTTQRITTRLQTDHKRTTNGDISTLVGHERHLLLFIFNECRAAGELVTAPLTLSRIKEELKVQSSSAAKTIIARLIGKTFLIRGKAKTGRGGWMSFHLEREIFQRLLIETDYKRTTNGSQTGYKETTKRATQRTTEPSSSSSSLRSISNEELLTTGALISAEMKDLDTAWEAIDSLPLTEIRFGRNQVVQIAREGKVTPDELQNSIYGFAFDLSENQKAKSMTGAPLNYFMGILRKGPYTPPANYEAPEDRQRRLYLEAKEQQLKRRQEIEARLETVKFEEWADMLSLEQRAGLVPPKDFAKPGSTAHTIQLREYFRENVWPQLKESSKISPANISS